MELLKSSIYFEMDGFDLAMLSTLNYYHFCVYLD